MTKKTTKILWGWLSCTLVIACSGGDKDTAGAVTASSSSSTSTTASTNSTNSATTSDSSTSTTSETSGTATESSTTSTTGIDTCGCSFVDCQCEPDPIQCDLWNDDCPEGHKCMPWANDGGWSWNATKCSEIDPMPGKPGDPCTVDGSSVTGIDSCEKGAMCWNVDFETMMGYCVGFCDGSPESFSCAEQGTVCNIASNGVLILCLPGCDPLLQDCPFGALCISGGDGFKCDLDASGDGGQYGDPCEFANACDPGLVCLTPEYVPGCMAGGCCSPFCELDVDYEPVPAPAPNCPGPAMACLNWFKAGMAPPGQAKVGLCGVAQ